MSELTMSMFANSKEYWKARAESAEYQLAALKEENERLMRLHADTCIKAGDEITRLKARVAELEGRLENIFFEFRQWTIIYNPKPIPPSCGVDWDFVHAECDGENGLAGTGKDPADCLRQIAEIIQGASQ